MRYIEREALSSNPVTQTLFRLMDLKQTNLCLAADVTTKAELLRLADLIGPEICVLKTHIDIVADFDSDLTVQLQSLAEKHRFLIFEDRKFADIGHTVKHQYRDGIYHIADWAHLVSAHILPGPGIIEGLKEAGLPKGRGLVLLAEMSSKGHFLTAEYTAAAVKLAETYPDFVVGFIAMRQLTVNPAFIHFTPGVQLAVGGDALGQQYHTPENVIGKQKSDVIIVGRGIYEVADPVGEAKKYREVSWKAYEQKLI